MGEENEEFERQAYENYPYTVFRDAAKRYALKLKARKKAEMRRHEFERGVHATIEALENAEYEPVNLEELRELLLNGESTNKEG